MQEEEEEESCVGEWGQRVQLLLESQLWSCARAPVLESHMKGTALSTRAVSRSN